jgi:hypothetical protein
MNDVKGQDISWGEAAPTDQALRDLIAGYREMGQLNLFLAEEAVYSDEEAFDWILTDSAEAPPPLRRRDEC